MSRTRIDYTWPEQNRVVNVPLLSKEWDRPRETINKWAHQCNGNIEMVYQRHLFRLDNKNMGIRVPEHLGGKGKPPTPVEEQRIVSAVRPVAPVVVCLELEKGTTKDEIKPSYKQTRCLCPKCSKPHLVKMWWTGTGSPRKYCDGCRGIAKGVARGWEY